jgi:hypothetical protein
MRLVTLGDEAVPALLDKLASAQSYPPDVKGPDDARTLIEILSEIGTEKALPFIDEEKTRMISRLSLSQAPVDKAKYGPNLWAAHCKERITIWSSPDRFDQLVRSLEKPYLRKWTIYKLGILRDEKAVPHLEKMRDQSDQLDLRESARDSIDHIQSGGKMPLAYKDHLAEERFQIATARDVYTLGQPVVVQYELIAGAYGSRTLVRFAGATGHLLPFGLAGPKGYDRYKVQVARKGTDAELLSEPIDEVPLEEFNLAPRQSVKGQIDIAEAYRLEPGEYQICVCLGDCFVFSNMIKIQLSR